MIKAVIFDMDGLLIDSEPLWQETEIEIFNAVGVPLTNEMCRQTTGMRIEEVVQHWHTHYPWYHRPVREVARDIIQGVKQRVLEISAPMPGVDYITDFFRKRNIKMALASSSAYELIDTVVDKFGMRPLLEFVYSADDEEYGKPHPGIYLSALRRLKIKANECLAFEDSYNGVLSASSARIKTIAVPDPQVWDQSRFDIADLKLRSLLDFNDAHLEQFNKQ